jgi:hypothetical protein
LQQVARGVAALVGGAPLVYADQPGETDVYCVSAEYRGPGALVTGSETGRVESPEWLAQVLQAMRDGCCHDAITDHGYLGCMWCPCREPGPMPYETEPKS